MLPLLLFVTQLVQQSGACDLYGNDYDHGEDYLSWTSVYSLGQCMDKCKSTYNCDGITWVKNYNRNCALYDSRGTRSGVTRRGQDSYINCNSGGGSGGGVSSSGGGEESCSGNGSAARSAGVYCLNDEGMVTCRSRSDCPPDVKDYSVAGCEGCESGIAYSYKCDDDGTYGPAGTCAETKRPFCVPGGWEDPVVVCAFDVKPLTTSSSTVGQSFRSVSQRLANRSGCKPTKPCRYRGGQCGRLVGIGRGGSAACPKKPAFRG